MSKHTNNKVKEWDSNWGSIVKSRITGRGSYPGGPAAGPEILKKYHQYYDMANKDLKEPSILVLGATPELRDYALSQRAKVTVLDQSQEIIKSMSSVMEFGDSQNESRMVGDWLDMPLQDNTFDFIWGDGVSNNILFTAHNKLFSEIFRVLKSTGHILLREFFIDQDEKELSIKDSIDWAHQNKMHRYDLFFKLYGYANDGHIDKSKHLLDMGIISKNMEKDIYGRGILNNEEEKCLKDFMTGTVKTTFLIQSMWRKNFEKYFNLIDIGVVDDYRFCRYFNFVFAKPK